MDYVSFPFYITKLGKTELTNYKNYIRTLIEQIVSTVPGERVNRPNFGCGFKLLVFSAIDNEVLNKMKDDIQCSLETNLDDIITVDETSLFMKDNSMNLKIQYTINRNQYKDNIEFMRDLL